MNPKKNQRRYRFSFSIHALDSPPFHSQPWLRCLCIGTSCGFTTAQTFSLWQVEQAEVSGTKPQSAILWPAQLSLFRLPPQGIRREGGYGASLSVELVAGLVRGPEDQAGLTPLHCPAQGRLNTTLHIQVLVHLRKSTKLRQRIFYAILQRLPLKRLQPDNKGGGEGVLRKGPSTVCRF